MKIAHTLKQHLAANRVTVGSWITLAHPAIAEIMAHAGFDWLTLDVEPAANAVILYMMDVSGSMTDEQKQIVRTEAFWIDTWLRSNYEGLERRYIIHDAAAQVAVVLARQLSPQPLPRGTLLNVNVPCRPYRHLRGIAITRQGLRVYRDALVPGSPDQVADVGDLHQAPLAGDEVVRAHRLLAAGERGQGTRRIVVAGDERQRPDRRARVYAEQCVNRAAARMHRDGARCRGSIGPPQRSAAGQTRTRGIGR